MLAEKRKDWGKLVRVKAEVEELVDKIAERVGFQRYTVRNVAILFGLIQIALGYRVPSYDEEFLELLETAREFVSEWLGEGKHA